MFRVSPTARRLGFILQLVFGLTICFSTPAQAQYDGAAGIPDMYAEGFGSISEQDSENLLKVLAGEQFAGRGTGQQGYLEAAQWFAEQLKTLGFQPAGPNDSWFQNVPFIRLTVVPENTGLQVNDMPVVAAVDLGLSQYVGEFRQQLPAVFAAVTEDRPDVTDDQFAEKLLVVRSSKRFRVSDPMIRTGRPACVLIVSDESGIRSESVSRLEESPISTPVMQISTSAAATLAEACGVSGALFSGKPAERNLLVSSNQPVDCQLNIVRESIDVPNVVAWYPGSDESVRHEYVAIGAHLDHLGTQRNAVYPGADDNGSGSTAVLQIAKAINSSSSPPRRSVLLMAFCAEERGLLGSKYYCENPLRPLKDMICMLNIDMIGRNEETADEPASENRNTIHLVGSRKISDQLHEMVLDANKYVNFIFEYDEERVYNRSDHASFAAKGIPTTFLFGGFNPHYHKPTDTLEGINFQKIANAARLNFLTLMMAAEHGHFLRNEDSSANDTP